MKHILKIIAVCLVFISCNNTEIKEINVGFIGPLSERAIDLGEGPAKSIELAINEYNVKKTAAAPKVNLFVEDDQWEAEKAIPAYDKLRKEHNIKVLFISNTGGTLALQEKAKKDGVIIINVINNDELLSSLNRNTFKIAKRTEEAHEIIGARIKELQLKNILIFHFPNDFMERGAKSVAAELSDNNIKYKIIKIKKGQKDYTKELSGAKQSQTDGICFFGYRNFGYAMKQAREMGITAKFFGSTTLFDPMFYKNSEGHIVGTECTYFTEQDGNYVLASKFVADYKKVFNSEPPSIWPAMQAYDAANIFLHLIKNVNNEGSDKDFTNWLRAKLYRVDYYQGVCGNISMGPDGASKGIYFTNYIYGENQKPVKVKR